MSLSRSCPGATEIAGKLNSARRCWGFDTMKPSAVTESPAESRAPKSEYTGLTSRAAMKAPLLSLRKPRKVEKPARQDGISPAVQIAVAGQGSRAFACASGSHLRRPAYRWPGCP